MGIWTLGWPELPPDIYLPEDARAVQRRCKHGVLFPHECRECEADATPEVRRLTWRKDDAQEVHKLGLLQNSDGVAGSDANWQVVFVDAGASRLARRLTLQLTCRRRRSG